MGAACTGVDPSYYSQSDTINPSGVVIYGSQIGFLNAIDPQSQTTIIRAHCSRRAPIELDKVGRIGDGEPTGVCPGCGIVYQPSPYLINS